MNYCEEIPQFLNKTQAIVCQDRGTHISVLQNIKKSQYTCNSAPIYDIDIPHCVATVGIGLKFTLDVDIGTAPTLEDYNHSIMSQYL